MADYSGSDDAEHLCVMVHGLWGNPVHMASLAKTLRAQHPRDKLHILVTKSNSGSFTYDGIELGGERVCAEIEEELAAIAKRGGQIKKLSLVGYSLGGLVARYAIGLLFARGVLDKLECMNFTTFASPYLGVRSPLRGWLNQTFNILGARTLCASGKQLFGVDKFRDTGKPLLAVLADPKSIFMSGLAKFQRRTLYANVTNDRTAVYYTTGLSKTDPFTDMSKVHVNYVKGYEDVILDPVNPVAPTVPPEEPPLNFKARTRKGLGRIPFIMALIVFVPIGVTAYLINAAIQTVRSSRRVKQHEKGLGGIKTENYRMNLWINELREAVEDAYEGLGASQPQDYLSQPASEDGSDADDSGEEILALERKQSIVGRPTLALAPYQFAALQALDNLGWRKYPVWIHNVTHSHAAIVVRTERPSFAEGQVVLNHFAKEEFLL